MDKGGTTIKTGIYCRGCDYDLRESALRCPECGRSFDAGNPKTYFTSPRSLRVRRWVRRVVLLILLVALPPALGLGWLWWGWKAEQGHIVALEQAGWDCSQVEPMYRWLPKFLPREYRYLTLRADFIWWNERQLSQDEMQHVGRLMRLRRLDLTSPATSDGHLQHLRRLTRLQEVAIRGHGITDAGLEHLVDMQGMQCLDIRDTSITGPGLKHLSSMSGLRQLWLCASPLGDEGLIHLGPLKELRTLDLTSTRIGDMGMKHIAALTEIEELWLGGTSISDAGLRHIAGLKNLGTLCLCGTMITDAGLEHLRRLPGLRFVDLHDTRVTPLGVQGLRTATPQLKMFVCPRRPDSPAPATAPAGNTGR